MHSAHTADSARSRRQHDQEGARRPPRTPGDDASKTTCELRRSSGPRRAWIARGERAADRVLKAASAVRAHRRARQKARRRAVRGLAARRARADLTERRRMVARRSRGRADSVFRLLAALKRIPLRWPDEPERRQKGARRRRSCRQRSGSPSSSQRNGQVECGGTACAARLRRQSRRSRWRP